MRFVPLKTHPALSISANLYCRVRDCDDAFRPALLNPSRSTLGTRTQSLPPLFSDKLYSDLDRTVSPSGQRGPDASSVASAP